MYFVMYDFIEHGVTYPRRSGRLTESFKVAKRHAIRIKGYVLDEHRKLHGQAIDSSAPLFLDNRKNISSGEDVCLK